LIEDDGNLRFVSSRGMMRRGRKKKEQTSM
jgi:hypothetical protein